MAGWSVFPSPTKQSRIVSSNACAPPTPNRTQDTPTLVSELHALELHEADRRADSPTCGTTSSSLRQAVRTARTCSLMSLPWSSLCTTRHPPEGGRAASAPSCRLPSHCPSPDTLPDGPDLPDRLEQAVEEVDQLLFSARQALHTSEGGASSAVRPFDPTTGRCTAVPTPAIAHLLHQLAHDDAGRDLWPSKDEAGAAQVSAG